MVGMRDGVGTSIIKVCRNPVYVRSFRLNDVEFFLTAMSCRTIQAL